MNRLNPMFLVTAILVFGLFFSACQPVTPEMAAGTPEPERLATEEERIANAMSAGVPALAQDATILDWPEEWPGNWPDEPGPELVEIRAGTNGWTCLVDNPDTPGNDPMCLNEPMLELRLGQIALEDAPSTGIGIGYMLQGGGPVGSAPHVMFFTPESNASHVAFTQDPGPEPWVMYPETSYQHLMVTVVQDTWSAP